MKLINGNAAYEKITDLAGKATTKSAYRAYWESAKIIKGMISEGIEVVGCQPIIHAKWIPYGRDSAYTRFFRCSRCNYEIPIYEDAEKNLYNYCPNCGVEMKG